MLNKEEVEKLAKLARIDLTEQEIQKFQKGLTQILEYIEELKTLDTEGVLELSQVTGLENVYRKDAPVMTQIREEIMANAPELKDGYYKVKAIF